MKPTEFIWRDGRFVPWAEATTHVLAHVLHYGSGVFEGIRAYQTKGGTQYFRLDCHLRRLLESAKVYDMPMRWDVAQLGAACRELLQRNRMPAAYVRPLAFRGPGVMGLDPTNAPVETIIACWDWGKYLGNEQNGIDVCVSSWRRMAPSTLPAQAKASGNYLSSQLIRLEAKRNGCAEGIALTHDGFVSEGSGENVFVVKGGVVRTPDAGSGVLLGITRDCAMRLLHEQGIGVREERIPREALYTADEVFLTGTAAEITAVRSVDRITVGAGKPGPITRALQERFFGLFDGRTEDRHGWLSKV